MSIKIEWRTLTPHKWKATQLVINGDVEELYWHTPEGFRLGTGRKHFLNETPIRKVILKSALAKRIREIEALQTTLAAI